MKFFFESFCILYSLSWLDMRSFREDYYIVYISCMYYRLCPYIWKQSKNLFLFTFFKMTFVLVYALVILKGACFLIIIKKILILRDQPKIDLEI